MYYSNILCSLFFPLSGNLTVSQPCIHNWQCTGTKYSSLCKNKLCRCRPEYIKNGSYCYPGKLKYYYY